MVRLLRGFDPAENKVQIKARLLNELVLNTKKWSFEDVTPGKKSFTLHSIGDIAGDKLTNSVSRIDIAAGAITGLTEEDDGKTIVFTVCGNFSSGRIVAKVKASADSRHARADGRHHQGEDRLGRRRQRVVGS